MITWAVVHLLCYKVGHFDNFKDVLLMGIFADLFLGSLFILTTAFVLIGKI